MRKLFFILILALVMSASSCTQHAFACFTTEPDEDSLHVNQPVIFHAACSTGADAYYWELYNKEDSTFEGQPLTKVFKDTGHVHVFLLITSGGRTASTERDIFIRP